MLSVPRKSRTEERKQTIQNEQAKRPGFRWLCGSFLYPENFGRYDLRTGLTGGRLEKSGRHSPEKAGIREWVRGIITSRRRPKQSFGRLRNHQNGNGTKTGFSFRQRFAPGACRNSLIYCQKSESSDGFRKHCNSMGGRKRSPVTENRSSP